MMCSCSILLSYANWITAVKNQNTCHSIANKMYKNLTGSEKNAYITKKKKKCSSERINFESDEESQ